MVLKIIYHYIDYESANERGAGVEVDEKD